MKQDQDFIPETFTAYEAAFKIDGENDVDIRPRVMDNNTNTLTLVDSGSQCCVVNPDPGDVIDSSIKLESVSGDRIPCYGKKKISVKINRKQYHIVAVKAKVKETILGWDFIRRHRLDMVWSEFGDVFLRDKVNGISAPLTYQSIPHNSSPRFKTPKVTPPVINDTSTFEVHSVKQFPVPEEKVKHDQEYIKIVQQYPNLLTPTFKTKDSNVTHFIDTGDHLPSTCKVRHLAAGSRKATIGKEDFMELVKLGIVEPVDVSKPTLWSSPLHLQLKSNNRYRCCGDFRSLNKKTILDSFPIPSAFVSLKETHIED